MSRPINPSAVGFFVIGAIVLIVAAVLLFSSGHLLSRTFTLVAVFPGSLKGLTVGASVEIRGVRIGSVKDIKVLTDLKSKSITVPVYLEIVRDSMEDMAFHSRASEEKTKQEMLRELDSLIRAGLRAQLSLKSMVTGQLVVDIDFHPDTPIHLTGVDERYPEIPTVEAITDRMINQIQNLPLQDLVYKAVQLLENLDHLLNSQDVRGTLANIHQATQRTNHLLKHVDAQIEPLSASIQSTLTGIATLTRHIDGQVQPVLAAAMTTLSAARKTLHHVDELIGKDSTTRADMERALTELAKAAASLRTLSDYLERHPEALLKGKGY